MELCTEGADSEESRLAARFCWVRLWRRLGLLLRNVGVGDDGGEFVVSWRGDRVSTTAISGEGTMMMLMVNHNFSIK